MKLLLNMNVLPQLAPRLVAAGHPCRHVRDIGLERAEDPEIIEVAKAGGEVIVTHDLDYGHLLAFSGEASPSVIIFRVRNTHPEALFAGSANAGRTSKTRSAKAPSSPSKMPRCAFGCCRLRVMSSRLLKNGLGEGNLLSEEQLVASNRD